MFLLTQQQVITNSIITTSITEKSHINKQTTYENPLLQQQQQQQSDGTGQQLSQSFKASSIAGMRTFKPSSSSLNSTTACGTNNGNKYTNGNGMNGTNNDTATSTINDMMSGPGGSGAAQQPTLTSTSSLVGAGILNHSAAANVTSSSTSTTGYRRPNQPPSTSSLKPGGMGNGNGNGAGGISSSNFYFTQNPDELRGDFIKTSLLKTAHGFGFTIIGANETSEDFLQIKFIVPDGAADRDGLLRQGDVLVYVNNECVLGYTHQDVVEIFQVPLSLFISRTIVIIFYVLKKYISLECILTRQYQWANVSS